jgi:hypothetical protein
MVLLAACSSTGARNAYVVLQSDSYICGAAEGLGCGLAIAPALAQLDALAGVQESRVSWDGRWFRIQLEPGASPERVAEAAAAVLEGPAQRVDVEHAPVEEGAWWNEQGTLELSLHEASELAADFTADIAATVELDEAQRAQLGALLREEIAQAFERAHAAGGGIPRLWEELPQARAQFAKRLDFLDVVQRSKVLEFLDRALGG